MPQTTGSPACGYTLPVLAVRDPDRAVPVPALGANVAWNLVTNAVLAAALVAAAG